MSEERGPRRAGEHDDDAIIHAAGVSKRYGDELAVDDLDLRIRPGIIFGFIGPSGSGKTTTVRLLTGIHRPTSGDIRVFGRQPTKFSVDDRQRIGYMPQLSVLYPHLSVKENLNFVGSIYGLPLRRRARLHGVLEFVELLEHRKKLLRDCSGGMQRRLALAASMLHEPELFFLDEPTAGIDPVLRRKFWDHFEELRRQGRTLFVTTQYVGEAAYCDLIGVLREGRLLMVDTPAGLRRRAYGGDVLSVVLDAAMDEQTLGELRALDFVHEALISRGDGRALRLVVQEADTATPRLQQWFDHRRRHLESIRHEQPPFDDVFVELVQDTPQPEAAHAS